jgi:hypothetical protein
MSDAVFLFRPSSDRAILSGGNWIADGDVALTNIQNDRYAQIARSASLSALDAQIRVDMRRAVDVRGFAVALPNATTTCSVRVSAYAGSDYAVPLFQTEWLDGGEAGDTWRDDERAPIVSAAFAQPVTARYWLVEFDDPLNPAGAIEVSRLFLAEGLSPSFNYSYGATLSFRNNTLSSSTLSGKLVQWRRISPRQWQCTFNYLPDAEAFGSVYDFLRYVGFDREVFIVPEPGDRANAQARRFFATVTQLDALSQAVVGRSNFGFGVEERVAPAAVVEDAVVVPTVTFQFSAFAPGVITGSAIDVPSSGFAFTAFAPDVATGSVVDVPSVTFRLVTYPPVLGDPTVIEVPAVEFAFADFAPDIVTGSAIDVPSCDFAFALYPPQPMRAFGSGFNAGFT